MRLHWHSWAFCGPFSSRGDAPPLQHGGCGTHAHPQHAYVASHSLSGGRAAAILVALSYAWMYGRYGEWTEAWLARTMPFAVARSPSDQARRPAQPAAALLPYWCTFAVLVPRTLYVSPASAASMGCAPPPDAPACLLHLHRA